MGGKSMSNGKGDKPRFYPDNKYRDNYNKIFNKKGKKKMNKSTKDKCVMCGAKTEYDKETHIDNRKNYIEGAGQMCQPCHQRIY